MHMYMCMYTQYSLAIVGVVYPSFPLHPSLQYFAQEVTCTGTEYSITQCDYNPPTSPECSNGNHAAAVVCRQSKFHCVAWISHNITRYIIIVMLFFILFYFFCTLI